MTIKPQVLPFLVFDLVFNICMAVSQKDWKQFNSRIWGI